MKSADVLFVAGNIDRLESIKIRCQDIAQRLDCDCFYHAQSVDELPKRYKAYVCVKPDFGHNGLEKLARRGVVIWDILDYDPPVAGVKLYVASTQVVQKTFDHLGPIRVIPHHHCNIERIPSAGGGRQVAYVGSEHWYPGPFKIPHQLHFTSSMTRIQVAESYRKVDLAINLRRIDTLPVTETHVRLNSGIKLINCLGFGIPSVSSNEPAYHEIAGHCTVFTDLENCERAVQELLQDQTRYAEMRKNCLELASKFHVDTVVNKYRKLFRAL